MIDGHSYDREIENLERAMAGMERQLDRENAARFEAEKLARDYKLENDNLRGQITQLLAEVAEARATKDMHKERQQELAAERDELIAQIRQLEGLHPMGNQDPDKRGLKA